MYHPKATFFYINVVTSVLQKKTRNSQQTKKTLEHTKDSFHTPSTFKNRKGKTTKNHHVSLVVSQSPRPTISFLEPLQTWQQPILDQLTRPTKTTGTSSLRRQIFGQKLLGGREEPEQAMMGMDTRASN